MVQPNTEVTTQLASSFHRVRFPDACRCEAQRPEHHRIDRLLLSNYYSVMRHGQSFAQTAQINMAHPEIAVAQYGLTNEGAHEVARAVQRWIQSCARSDRPIVLVHSPFLRGAESADIAEQLLGEQMLVRLEAFELRERFLGEFDGKSMAKWFRVAEFDREDPDNQRFGVESPRQLVARVSALVRRLDAEFSGVQFLFVSHSEVIQGLRCAFENVCPSLHSRHELFPFLKNAEVLDLHGPKQRAGISSGTSN